MRFTIARAGADDIGLLVSHRLSMWKDIRPELERAADESQDNTRKWIAKRLAEGRLVGFIAKTKDGRVAGSGCVWVREEQPRPTSRRNHVPYLMSMYTEPGFRRMGVASLVLKNALKWCRKMDYERVVLHASDAGRHLYESAGFEAGREMRLILKVPGKRKKASRKKAKHHTAPRFIACRPQRTLQGLHAEK